MSDQADPYADMVPAYGSPDVPMEVDLSAEAFMPEVPTQQAEAPAEQAEVPAEQAEVPAEQAEAPAEQAEAPAVEADTDRLDVKTLDAEKLAATVVGLRTQVAESAGQQAVVLEAITAQLGELLRLRARDVDLADRLYAENTRLRTGEFAAAVAPLLAGLLRLQDQMASLANGDSASVAGMLRTQLLQILDTAAGLVPFEPQPGERFDSARHAGVGRVVTADPAFEGTVAKTIKPGFERADGTVVRVAQVEVHRFDSR